MLKSIQNKTQENKNKYAYAIVFLEACTTIQNKNLK